MQNILKQQENLDIVEGMVEDLLIEEKIVKGVILDNGKVYLGKGSSVPGCNCV